MKRKLLLALGCVIGLATLSYGGHVWYNAFTYVSTDDAYVEGTISPVSAKVAGHVAALLVGDNQSVRHGDLLHLRARRARGDARDDRPAEREPRGGVRRGPREDRKSVV